MPNDRIAALQKMIERAPDDPRARFGLALEYEKLGRWEETAAQLTRYLELTDDEGNAWGRLGHALRQLGRDDEAMVAYRRGIAAARAHGHPTMATEFEEVIEDW
ncbi:MAG: tetratricopeptide repeat protein [Gemmatimonadetes bacterium]|nr:tetratricopeptide repeat protein [Gemmatimonadota bacterium]